MGFVTFPGISDTASHKDSMVSFCVACLIGVKPVVMLSGKRTRSAPCSFTAFSRYTSDFSIFACISNNISRLQACDPKKGYCPERLKHIRPAVTPCLGSCYLDDIHTHHLGRFNCNRTLYRPLTSATGDKKINSR